MKYLIFLGCLLFSLTSFGQIYQSKGIIVKKRFDFKTKFPASIIFTNGDTLKTQLPHFKYGNLSDTRLLKAIYFKVKKNILGYVTYRKYDNILDDLFDKRDKNANKQTEQQVKNILAQHQIDHIWIDGFYYKIFDYKDTRKPEQRNLFLGKKQQYYDVYFKLLTVDSISLYRNIWVREAPMMMDNNGVFTSSGTSNDESQYYLTINNKSYKLHGKKRKNNKILKAAFSKYSFFNEYVKQPKVSIGRIYEEQLFLDFIYLKEVYETIGKKHFNIKCLTTITLENGKILKPTIPHVLDGVFRRKKGFFQKYGVASNNDIKQLTIEGVEYKIFKTKKSYHIYMPLIEVDSITLYRALDIQSSPKQRIVPHYYLKVKDKFYNLTKEQKFGNQILRGAFINYPFFKNYLNQKHIQEGKISIQDHFKAFIKAYKTQHEQ